MKSKIKASTRGKARKTIRKMKSPEARQLAKIALELRSIMRRINALANTVDLIYHVPKPPKDTGKMKEKTAFDAAQDLADQLDPPCGPCGCPPSGACYIPTPCKHINDCEALRNAG